MPVPEGRWPVEPRGAHSSSGQLGSPPESDFVNGLFHWLAPRYDKALLLYTLGLDLRWKHELLVPIRPRPGERVLDLACGTGLILDRLERSVGYRGVVGLDPNRAMLLVHDRRSDGAPRVQATAEALPFRGSSFDIVTAGYLPKYVRLHRLAREVRRVLRPGGRLAMYDFSRPTPDTAGQLYTLYLDRVLPSLGRHRGRASPMWPVLFEFLRNTAHQSGWEERIGPALRAAGFESIRIRSTVGGAITWVWAIASESAQP